jgi:hypothetical protein
MVSVASNGKKTKAHTAVALPSSFAQFKDSKKASAFIDETLSLYAEVGERLHVAACVAAWHTFTHRNPALLNRLFAALRSNDQQALKLWLRRVQVTNGLIILGLIKPDAAIPTKDDGGPLSAEVIEEAEQAGTALGFENKQFAILSDTTAASNAAADLVAARWFEPDGKRDVKVFVRSNIAEVVTFADVDALQAVMRAVTPKSTGRREVVLSNKVGDLLTKIRDMVEPTLKQYKSMAETSSATH